MAGGTNRSGEADDVEVREARPDEFVGAMRLFEGVLLAVDAGAVRSAAAGDTGATLLVADDGGPVAGALYAEPSLPDDEPPPSGIPTDATHVVAVAVRRRRRGEGIGRALVGAAARRVDALTAAFDPDVRPFYDALGFEVVGDGDEGTRLWGVMRDRPGERET